MCACIVLLGCPFPASPPRSSPPPPPTAQVADIVQIEDTKRVQHLQQVLGQPARDRDRGVLILMHARRSKL